jgi:hypothetical protein
VVRFERAREQVVARAGDEGASYRLTFKAVSHFGREVELKIALQDLNRVVAL